MKYYKGVYKSLRSYWAAYGGWPAFWLSPYLHFSFFITALSFNIWRNGDWWNLPLEILPNLIGFTLGGLAIWLAFGDRGFQKLIAEKDAESAHSFYRQANAAFVHFVFFQFIALLFALIGKALFTFSAFPLLELLVSPATAHLSLLIGGLLVSFIGYLLFIYSISTGVAATFAVFKLAGLFEAYLNQDDSK